MLDNLINTEDVHSIKGSTPIPDSDGHHFVDGDTLRNTEGKLLRIQGLSAPEVSRFLSKQGMSLTPGQPGGIETARQLESLAKQFGFKNVKYLTDDYGKPLLDATKSRQMIRLEDDQGRDFTETLLRYGIGDIGRFSTEDEVVAKEWADAREDKRITISDGVPVLNEWDKAGLQIDNAIQGESLYKKMFKHAAYNEQQLAALHAARQPGESLEAYAERKKAAKFYSTITVQDRHADRTLLNKALNPFSKGWDLGWKGALEGMYGAFEMIGERSRWNWLEEIGEEGIRRKREEISQMPELKLNALKPVLDDDGKVIGNEWDIKNLSEFFEYLGTNTAVSLPYMAISAGAYAAPLVVGPVGFAAYAAPAGVFAGQTWNEMEGDNKSASLATAAGVTMALLDRFGIKLIMGTSKGTLLNSTYRNKMVNAIVKKSNGRLTLTQARNLLQKGTRIEAARLLDNAVGVAKDQLKATNVLRSLAQRGTIGFVGEGLTEAGQELTSYMAAVIGSDKKFDAVQLQNRLLNAALAGGTIGSGFSIPGVAYDAGAWVDAKVQLDDANPNKLSFAGTWAQKDAKSSYIQLQKPTVIGGKTFAKGKHLLSDIEPVERSNNIEEINYNTSTEVQQRRNRFVNKVRSLMKDTKDSTGKIIKKGLSKQEAIKQAKSESDTSWQEKLDQSVKDKREDQKGKDAFEKAKGFFNTIPGLWRGSTRLIFTEPMLKASRALRDVAAMTGGTLQRLRPGAIFEERKRHKLTEYRQLTYSSAEVAAALGMGKINRKKIAAIITQFNYWVNDITKNRKDKTLRQSDWDNLPRDLKPYRAFLSDWYVKMQQFEKKLYNDQKEKTEANGRKFDVGQLDNYMQQYKSFNKVAIEKNQGKFANLLSQEYNIDLERAKEITRDILEQGDLTDEDSLFHVGRGRHVPAAHKSKRLGLATNPAFEEFMETDPFMNISNAGKAAARYVTYQEFLGDNMDKINEKLNQAIDEGVDVKVVNKIASHLQDYFDADSGNYKRIQNQTLANIQKNGLFWTTMAGLPMAVVSSFVELVITLRALNKNQIQKTIMNAAKEGAQALWATIQDPRFSSTKTQLAKEKRQEKIKDLGYFDWDVGAAQTTGATENSHASRKVLDGFFRIILLQQWTDYTRSIRASIANDFIQEKLSLINQFKKDGLNYSNQVQEAEEQLRNLGINVEQYYSFYYDKTDEPRQSLSPEEERVFLDMKRNAEFNFVNEAVALPMTYNRPLFYQNQHLALFTQFQGFIATFSANHIPRMWGEYVRRGNPAMKYNAFAVMSTMLLLGFAAQYLKDLLKYGKTSPYLDTLEYYQRGLGASGLIGVAERPLNFFFPIYETSSKNPAEWFFNTISGEAAALSNLTRFLGGTGKMLEGDTERGLYQIFKTTPGIGPFNQFNKAAAHKVNAFFGG